MVHVLVHLVLGRYPRPFLFLSLCLGLGVEPQKQYYMLEVRDVFKGTQINLTWW
jgi:hypothetical protein